MRHRNYTLKNNLFILICLITIMSLFHGTTLAGWDVVPEILSRIKAPEFPNLDFDVTQYGAEGDGVTDCTGAFSRAINACSLAGGGRVVVPEGNFLTGAIHLKSNVNLHLYIKGYEHTPIRDIRIINCVFENASLPDVIENVEGLKIDQ